MILEMLTGGGLVLIGSGIGFIFGRISRKTTKPNHTEAICEGCEHNYSWVDKETGKCTAPTELVTKRDEWGDPIKWLSQPCGCPTYNGPVPLPEYYAHEIQQ